MNTRKWISKIHLYGGLFCFWYLIIFAVSSLYFHHHKPSKKQNYKYEKTFSKRLVLPDSADSRELAGIIQEKLDLTGWYLPWATYRDKAGTFHTEFQNPRAQYLITQDMSSDSIKITRREKGMWTVINSLHGFSGKMPNAPMLFFWKIFTYVCLVVVVFSVFSGVWLWAKRSTERQKGLILISAFILLSLLLMINVYFNG